MTEQVDQEYIDDAKDELAYFVAETGRKMNQYVKGNASEEDIQRVADRAVETYKQLESRLDEATQQLGQRNVTDEFREQVKDAGYDDVPAFIEGRTPINASGENPRKQVFEKFTESDYIEVTEAYDVMDDYLSLTGDLLENYDVEIAIPEVDEKIDEMIEEMEFLQDEEDFSNGEN